MIHDLKTDPKPFAAVASGAKTFELRKADRPFDKLDLLLLRETKATGNQMAAHPRQFPLTYTGREILARVTYILDGPIYGLTDGWCILGLVVVEVAKQPLAKDRIEALDWNATATIDPEILKRVEDWRANSPLHRRAGPPLKSTVADLIGEGLLVPPKVHAITLPGPFLDPVEVEAGMAKVRDNSSAYMKAALVEPITKADADAVKACPGPRKTIPPVKSWRDVECHECFGTQLVAGKPCPHCTARKRR